MKQMLLRLCVVVALGWLLKSKPAVAAEHAIPPFVAEGRLLTQEFRTERTNLNYRTDSNDVFSFVTTPSTPLTGYRVASVSIRPIWVIGSPPKMYGIEECSYWTDPTGQTILWPANRTRQAGDKRHRYTRMRFGQVSVSVPLPPKQMGILAAVLVVVS